MTGDHRSFPPAMTACGQRASRRKGHDGLMPGKADAGTPGDLGRRNDGNAARNRSKHWRRHRANGLRRRVWACRPRRRAGISEQARHGWTAWMDGMVGPVSAARKARRGQGSITANREMPPLGQDRAPQQKIWLRRRKTGPAFPPCIALICAGRAPPAKIDEAGHRPRPFVSRLSGGRRLAGLK